MQNDPRPAPDAAEEPPRSPAHHGGAVAGVGRRAATGRLSGNAADWASCSGGLYRSAQRRDRRESRARGAEDGLLRDRGKPHRLHHLVAIRTVGEPEFRAPCGRCRVPVAASSAKYCRETIRIPSPYTMAISSTSASTELRSRNADAMAQPPRAPGQHRPPLPSVRHTARRRWGGQPRVHRRQFHLILNYPDQGGLDNRVTDGARAG